MLSQRNQDPPMTILEQRNRSLADSKAQADAQEEMPEIPSHIIAKLLGFTAAMFILPIISFFLTRDWVFKGNAGYAGAFAAVTANVVLFGYIYVAFMDDKQERAEMEAEEKKKTK